MRQYEELPFKKRRELQLKIEDAICPVLIEYFEKDALGNDTYPEIWSLQNDIENYDPDFIEPPDEFFKEMMEDAGINSVTVKKSGLVENI